MARETGGDREGPSPPGPTNSISWVGPGGPNIQGADDKLGQTSQLYKNYHIFFESECIDLNFAHVFLGISASSFTQ